MHILIFGRLLSEMEQKFLPRFSFRAILLEEVMKDKEAFKRQAAKDGLKVTKKQIDAVEIFLKQQDQVICDEFLKAVNNFDRQRIIEIADAVWFFRGFFKGGFDLNKCVDARRIKLHMAKYFLNRAGRKVRIKQVAQFLYDKEDVSGVDLKNLDRICRGMGFPLVENRHNSKK